MTNPALPPAQKVVGYCALLATGAAPGRPATERTSDFTGYAPLGVEAQEL